MPMYCLRVAVAALLLGCLLAACSTEELPLVGSSPTVLPAAESPVVPTRAAPPTSAPLATHLPLPTSAPIATLGPTITNALEQQQALLVELYRRVNPAVVSIDVSGHKTDDQATPEADLPYAQGSGFLYDDQGHIVTNNHVVEDATGFQVRFSDGSLVTAQFVGRDPGSDLAVIKVDELPAGAAPLGLADSRTVEVGQTAIAIGNPFGLQNTLTVGVISGLGRSLTGPSNADGGFFSIPNVIQTDAAINPGNSGGPLLNIKGEVIGVNTAIRTDSGTFQGVGYAVPSNALTRVIPALIRDGSYQHPWLGIRMRDVDPLFARHFGLPVQQGVLVVEVQANSPAASAPLRGGRQRGEYEGASVAYDGDIITAIAGQPVHSSDDLVSYLELQTSVGDTVTFTVFRDGSEQPVAVTLGSRPGQ
jgi:2-alkenal reductase